MFDQDEYAYCSALREGDMFVHIDRAIFTGWSAALNSSKPHYFENEHAHIRYGVPRFGAALLWYRPERRLSLSIWLMPYGSRNVRLWGPRKLSFER